jgi:signal transduction histidine kinase
LIYCQDNQILKQLSVLDSLIKTNKLEQANSLIKKINNDTLNYNKNTKADLYYLLGKYYEKKDREEIAFAYFKKASALYKKTKNDKNLMNVYFDTALLLNRRTHLKNDAKSYIDKIYEFAQTNQDTALFNKAYFGYALLNFNKTNYKKAFNYYKKIIQLNKNKNLNAHARAYNNIAIIYDNYFKKVDSARYYYKKSIATYNKLKANREEFATTLNLGTSYKTEKNYREALKWLEKADKIPLTKYRKNYKTILYSHFADTYEKIKDYKNALNYLKLKNAYKDSVNIEKQLLAITDMETKYKAVQKEKENIKLKAVKKQQLLYIIILSGSLIAGLAIGLLYVRNAKQKNEVIKKEKEIEQEKVANLVKEQEILAMNAMLEGQEKERLRLAEDLHDNIGSSIATLKMQFDTFKNIAQKENTQQYDAIEKTSTLLDETYQKVRYLAHTNHVSVMENHGLITSLKLLTKKLSDTKQLSVDFNHYGFNKKLNTSLELNIFRIIQEIITNIIKHAKATEINIDINLFDDILTIIIEDNGIGFNVNKKLNSKKTGMGIQNLIKRVERENGKFSLDSQIGKGTTIVIEIPITNSEI